MKQILRTKVIKKEGVTDFTPDKLRGKAPNGGEGVTLGEAGFPEHKHRRCHPILSDDIEY
jgi:hypothetical protein